MGLFEGRVVIVTGASGGIGLAAARLFAHEGANVLITGRRVRVLEEVTVSYASIQVSISVFSVVYFSIDVARGEQTIANTSSERPKTKSPLSMRLPDPADGDIHY